VLAEALADHRNNFEERLRRSELAVADDRARKSMMSETWFKIGIGVLMLAVVVWRLNHAGFFDRPVEQPTKEAASTGALTYKKIAVSALKMKFRAQGSKTSELLADLPDEVLEAIMDKRISPEQAAAVYFLVKGQKPDAPKGKPLSPKQDAPQPKP
jgi:hypothetical protein